LQLSAGAQTMREIFIAMPDSIEPLLSKNNRMDMIDFMDNHMEARVTNRLDGQSVMDTLTADYVKVSLTSNAVMEMKLYEKGKDKVLLMVHTVGGPAKGSELLFFTPEWKPLKAQLKLPSFRTYEVNPRESLTAEQIELLDGLADMELVEMTLSPSNSLLTLTPSIGILSKEDQEKVKPLVKSVTLELR
jgi:hypothetical protein